MHGISPLKIKHVLEAIPVIIFFTICRLLPLDTASDFGGWLARTIGMRMGITRRADRNLARALPELTEEERKKILVEMWDNLGRVGAEYQHIDRLHKLGRIQGSEKGQSLIRELVSYNKGAILVGAHMANWEIGPTATAALGLPLAVIYRAPNNPIVDKIIKKARSKISSQTFPKGSEGALKLMRHLRQNGAVGILIDQKLNEGILIPFFGIPARTTPAPAELAIRFGTPLTIARVQRLGRSSHFTMDLKRVEIPNTGNRAADVATLTAAMTKQLEDWIRETPAQWLWLHNRWPKED